ncbi:MAG: hypothetical protein K0S22_1805 [Oscillospiraceae bacterium]|jgi:Holliday junction resolvase-like predicted endonuclease/GTPase SAR1 family protein|nr:hypothetical protein [Oscillospiraceae bacterium]
MRELNEGKHEKTCKGYGDIKCTNKSIEKSDYCRNCAGRKFEDQVAEIFKAQGYTVIQNVSNRATQIDFIAQLKYGFSSIRALVECKYKFKSDKTVSGEDVRKLFGTKAVYEKSNPHEHITHIYVVSNSPFSAQANEVAKELGVELFVYKDLLKQIIDFEPYLKHNIAEYEKSNLYNNYIDLLSEYGEPLSDYVFDSGDSDEDNALIIFGEYGSGKTSFCWNLTYNISKRILSGERLLVPIFIKLRDYNKAIDIESLISNLLINKLGIINGTIHTFEKYRKTEGILLIFDGFDEIAKRADYDVKYNVYSQIIKMVDSKTRVILTCRPNYFHDQDEYQAIFKSTHTFLEPSTTKYVDFQEVNIGELNSEQVIDYVSKYEHKLQEANISAGDFFSIIENTHDLSDLVKRPVLLNLIIETIPMFLKDKNTLESLNINSATLYEVYTRKWLDRENEKGKTLIKPIQKRLFCEELAFNMFLQHQSSIHYSKLPSTIKNFFSTLSDKDEIDYFSHDIQSCSFLSSQDEGYFGFIHKSFMEYFVAKTILEKLKVLYNKKLENERTSLTTVKAIDRLLGFTIITTEISFFLKDIIAIQPDKNILTKIQGLYSLYKDMITPCSQKNLVSILAKGNFDLSPAFYNVKDYGGIDLSYLKLQNTIIESVDFSGVSFYNVQFTNVIFINCIFTNSLWFKSNLIECSFINQTFGTAILNKACFTKCDFTKADMSLCNLNYAKFFQCNFLNADFTEAELNNNTQIENAMNLDTVIGLPYSFS